MQQKIIGMIDYVNRVTHLVTINITHGVFPIPFSSFIYGVYTHIKLNYMSSCTFAILLGCSIKYWRLCIASQLGSSISIDSRCIFSCMIAICYIANKVSYVL